MRDGRGATKPSARGEINVCFKGQTFQQAPHRGDRDGFCSLIRRHVGSRASSVAFGGDNKVERTTAGTGGEQKAAGRRGQVLMSSPTRHNPNKNRRTCLETSRYQLKMLK